MLVRLEKVFFFLHEIVFLKSPYTSAVFTHTKTKSKEKITMKNANIHSYFAGERTPRGHVKKS